MNVAILDAIAGVGYLTAAGVIAYALVRFRGRAPVSPTLFGLAAMLLLAWISLGNGLNAAGITSRLHAFEEYAEAFLMPLIVYFAFASRVHADTARMERERQVVDRLDARLNQSLAELGGQRIEVLQALTAAVDARDHYTAQHSLHVADYACAIAYRLGMRDELETLEQAGLLHDIGKIGVSDQLLLKPEQLTDEEYEVMQWHVVESANILGTTPFFSAVVPLVMHHHERWDGKGYPHGLKGEEIPEGARILAVADAFDAMTTDRPYRPALSVGEARRRLAEGKGSQFDPRIVDVWIELLDQGVLLPREVAQREMSAVA